jgi:hypothetical protein
MGMGELHESREDLKTTMRELLVALGNIILSKACFRLFFKLH